MRIVRVILSLIFIKTASVVSQKCERKDWDVCPDQFRFHQVPGYARCLLISGKVKLSFVDAGSLCVRRGARLLEIHDGTVQKHVEDLLKSLNDQHYWLNIRYQSAIKEYWWNPGTNGIKLTYTNWADKKGPNHQDGQCVKIDASTGLWSNSYCPIAFPYVCETDNFQDERHVPRIAAQFDRRPNVVFVGNVLNATCSAFVGVYHTLSWLYMEGQRMTYVTGHDTRIKNSISFGVRKGECKRKMTSVLTMELVTDRSTYNLTRRLTCGAHRENQTFTSRVCSGIGLTACAATEIVTEYTNRVPRIEADYHGPGHVVHDGRNLIIRCHACVGLRGNVSFSMEYLGSVKRLDKDDPNLSYTSVESPCGKNVTSTYHLTVTTNIMNYKYKCISYRHDDRLHVELNKLDSAILRLKVEYGPGTPDLVVSYHKFPYGVTLGHNKTARCSACVGNHGEITWDFVDRTNKTLGAEVIDKLDMLVETDIKEHVPGCGTRVVSDVTFTVTYALHRARIVCRSYNGTYLPGVQVVATSQAFYVEDDWGIGKGPKSNANLYILEAVPVMVFFLMVILLLMGIRIYLDKADPKNKKRRTVNPQQSRVVMARRSSSKKGKRRGTAASHPGESRMSLSSDSTNVDTGQREAHREKMVQLVLDPRQGDHHRARRRLKSHARNVRGVPPGKKSHARGGMQPAAGRATRDPRRHGGRGRRSTVTGATTAAGAGRGAVRMVGLRRPGGRLSGRTGPSSREAVSTANRTRFRSEDSIENTSVSPSTQAEESLAGGAEHDSPPPAPTVRSG